MSGPCSPFRLEQGFGLHHVQCQDHEPSQHISVIPPLPHLITVWLGETGSQFLPVTMLQHSPSANALQVDDITLLSSHSATLLNLFQLL